MRKFLLPYRIKMWFIDVRAGVDYSQDICKEDVICFILLNRIYHSRKVRRSKVDKESIMNYEDYTWWVNTYLLEILEYIVHKPRKR